MPRGWSVARRRSADDGVDLEQRHRRIAWIEWALEPCRDDLTRKDYDDLVPAPALVIGWEAFIVRLDVRGLSTTAARTLTLRTAEAILDAGPAAASGGC